jgi:hypothetical protein
VEKLPLSLGRAISREGKGVNICIFSMKWNDFWFIYSDWFFIYRPQQLYLRLLHLKIFGSGMPTLGCQGPITT